MGYIIVMRTMTEEQRKEELRKVEARVKAFAESVERVKALQHEFQREHEGHQKFGPFLKKF